MLTQIYCMSSVQEALDVIDAGADYIGIVPEQGLSTGANYTGEITWKMTASILDATRGRAKRVLLFAGNATQDCLNLLHRFRPDIVHLAGTVPVTDTLEKRIRDCVPGILIEWAIPVASEDAIALATERSKHADLLILDSVLPNRTGTGATGNTHDWQIDRRIVESVDIPVIIAGGLSPENVAQAIRIIQPAGVDSLTHTDRLRPDGTRSKDILRVHEFCAVAKADAH